MARHALLLPLLLILTATDHVICQNTIDLGSQQWPNCTLPFQQNLQRYNVGTIFSAQCSRECMQFSMANQEAARVFGTRVYDLDSDLCLAAVHDARLPHPSRLTGPATVRLTLVRYDQPFVASFRRGVGSGGRPYQSHQRGLQFVSDRVNEDVPDITIVHTNFRLSRTGTTYVKCHFGPSTLQSEVQIYRVSGGTTDVLYADRKHQSATAYDARDGESPPDVFLCRLTTSAYSDVTTIAYSGTPYYEPGQKNYRANAGDYVQMTSNPTRSWLTTPITWLRGGFSGLSPQGTGITYHKDLAIPNAKEEDTGIYLQAYSQGDRRYASATRLIVRACPANFFGTRCDQRCPYCLHGGQCHEETGQCVCPPGFTGLQCEIGCGKDRFGASCSSKCPIDNCRGRLLCAPDPYGCSCAPGWTGNDCTRGCARGQYGPDCAFQCGSCNRGECDIFTGYCDYGCSRTDVSLPLCKENQWPSFRDPPEVLEAGFTRVVVRHRRWRRQYDNGYSNGTLQYIGQITPADRLKRWSTLENSPVISDDSLGGSDYFELTFDELKVDTEYLMRIIIKVAWLKAQQDRDNLIQVAQTSTDCARPDEVGGIVREYLTGVSASFRFEDVTNKREACTYQLNVTLTAKSPGATGTTTRLIGPSELSQSHRFTNLRPYSEYTVTVFAMSRKGLSPAMSQDFRTPETAPSMVTNLKYLPSRQPQGTFSITWNRPAMPNGFIRRYEVHVKHSRFIACTTSPSNDRNDVFRTTTTDLKLEVALKHVFSTYDVTVAAVTVASGEKTSVTISTDRNAPTDIATVSVTGEQSSALLSWSWPSCSTWGDNRYNLRLQVLIQGKSSWNQASRDQRNLTTPGSSISELLPYSNYSLRVRFCNSVGCNPTSQDIDKRVRTLESAPGAPVNLTILAVSPTSVTVGWDPPRPPLSRIAGYRVSWSVYYSKTEDLTASDVCTSDATTRTSCHAKVYGLNENTEYSFTVYAISHTDVQGAASMTVRQKTGEGAPGPPEDLGFTNRSQTTLNISWLEPEEKNGRLRGFQLNVSLDELGSGRRRREAASFRSFDIAARQRGSRQLDVIDDKPYSQLVEDLRPGHGYLVQVAASTSAGFGDPIIAFMHTLVSPPIIRGQPSVTSDRTTDSTVLLVIPPAENSGGPVSSYLVVVSTDVDFDGSQLKPDKILNVEKSGEAGPSYYVTAALSPDRVARDNTFVVGDGRYYNSSETPYLNRPLTTGATYRLGVAVLSRISEDNQQLAFQPIAAPVIVMEPSASPLVPVVLVLLFLLVIGAAVGAFLYRRSRRKMGVLRNGGQHPAADVPLNALPAMEREEMEDNIENEDTEDEEAIYENIQPDQINYSRIELKDLAERIRAGIRSDELKAQLQNLPHGLNKSCTVGELAENRRKNRYVNLLPYDESRVVLHKMPGDDSSDYINANFIEGYNRPRAYIACQGPKKETVFDFWRMVWQEKVTRIVMLTNLVESGKRKCDEYWPDSERLRLPGLTVLSDTKHVFSDYTVRRLFVRKGSETRAVTHFHYTVWPDHSVPKYPSSLAKFIKAVNGVDDGAAPTVVHCSAGVGRTGTVILIDTMYQMGLREQAVDVFSHLAIIRQQRANLCANLPQYKLVHQVLVDLLVSPSAAVPAAQVANRLAKLRKPGKNGPSQLELQLRYLDEQRPVANNASVRGLQLDGKNRSPEVLPEDASRVFLDPKMRDNYINAVYVQGYKVQDAFIATEAPLPARKYIFWQMVVQKHSRIIVVMNDLEEKDVFWPTEGQADVYRDLKVQSKGESVTDDITTISLKITHSDSNQVKGTLDVSVLVLADADRAEGGGERPSCLPTAPALLRLYSAYMRSAAPLGDLPTVVVCRSGVSGCGLFVTVCFELEHLSEEQELDVTMAVSTVRRSRPQFITGLAQFELCYDVAVSWLEAFATYANFQ